MRGVVILALAAAAAPAANAQAGRPALSANAGVATEYVFRGVSQTGGQPQVFAGADLTSGALYAGAWASNVDYGDGTDAEVDLYGGARREWGGWSVDLGGIAYLYPGQPDGAAYDYVELKLGASRPVGRSTISAAVFWTPDFGGAARQGTYAELAASHPLGERWTVSAVVGHPALAASRADYGHWAVGVSWAATAQAALELRYHATSAEERLGALYDERLVAGLKLAY